MNRQPKPRKAVPAIQRWEQPAGQVGGDFVVVYRDARYLRIFLGDVTGHGLAAAGVARRARRMIAASLGELLGVGLFQRWNAVVSRWAENRFVAFACVEIDIVTGQTGIAVGGNPAVVLRRHTNRAIETFAPNGMPLGVLDNDEWRAPIVHRTSLAVGDEIFCFTDGLLDAMGRDVAERFGWDRLLAMVASHEPGEGLQSLSRSLGAFADHSIEQDDVTVLAIGDVWRHAA